MLIPFNTIQDKYNIVCKKAIHVGAHKAEERQTYNENGLGQVVWVEANPILIENLRVAVNEEDIVLQAVVSDVDGQECTFNCTTSTQSSSILKLGLHSVFFPRIKVEETFTAKTITLQKLFFENNLSIKDFDLINVDIQGADLLALKGLGNDISYLKVIYTEINTKPMYEDGPLLDEMDEYLGKYNFQRVETKMWKNHPWGDAIYVNSVQEYSSSK